MWHVLTGFVHHDAAVTANRTHTMSRVENLKVTEDPIGIGIAMDASWFGKVGRLLSQNNQRLGTGVLLPISGF